jgi:two-component system cell cycle sensor histidine kinase/response regulator CckA
MVDRAGIWTIDAAGNTTFASEIMAEMLRTTVEDMIGKPSFQFVFPEDVETARELFEGKARGDTKPFEFRIRRADGTPAWVMIQGTPMRDETGRFLGIIGTFQAMHREGSIKSRTRTADKSA